MIIPLKTQEKKESHSRPIKSVIFGSKTLSHQAPKMWELVPVEIKNVNLVASLRNGNQ